MLKIKDNVDLKELEKYGFKLSYYSWCENGVYERPIVYPENSSQQVYVDITTRKIDEETTRFNVIDVKKEHIQDLIKADLVEKVSDGNESHN